MERYHATPPSGALVLVNVCVIVQQVCVLQQCEEEAATADTKYMTFSRSRLLSKQVQMPRGLAKDGNDLGTRVFVYSSNSGYPQISKVWLTDQLHFCERVCARIFLLPATGKMCCVVD